MMVMENSLPHPPAHTTFYRCGFRPGTRRDKFDTSQAFYCCNHQRKLDERSSTTGQETSKRTRPSSSLVDAESTKKHVRATAAPAAPVAESADTMSSGANFHSIKVGDTMFTVLMRYTDLANIGSGAQGVVW